jgi:hypothetical protein
MEEIMRLKFLALLLLAAMALLISSCYYDYGMEAEEYDLVATFYDTKVDFNQLKTYSMNDTIVHLVGEGKESDISRDYDQIILQQVALNMQTLGYRRIMDPDTLDNKPDIILAAGVTTSENFVLSSSYPYYGGGYYWGGYPWYGPGWGMWYPWYPVTGVYQYTTGTILITMLDADRIDVENKRFFAVWTAGINGLLTGNSSTVKRRLNSNISQAFQQSPYLGAGK